MHEVMRAESAGFFFFAGRGGEGGDFCAEDARKLNGDVAEAADADDANARRGIDAVVAQRDCRQ